MIHNPVVMDITVSGSDPVLQSKSVSPSESKQTVTPDVGYDGLSSVSVSAIQTETKTVTTNGTVTPSSGKYLKQVTVNVPTSSSPVLQTKSVTPSESSQNVTPDAGYDGLSKVTVGAIQTETKTVTTNGTVTPSSGKYLKQVTVNVPSSGINTSDATATADDIAYNKTAYANGEKLTGTLQEYSSGQPATFVSNYTKVRDTGDINLQCRGLNKGAKILRDGSYADVYVDKPEFGDASAADVAKGKTFTSSAGLKVTGTHICSGGIDTSDATATADDIAKNKTAYINGEKVTGSLILVNDFNLNSDASWDSQNSKLILSATPPKKCIFLANGSIKLFCTGENLGDATASDVAKGKTFTSASGLKVTGTHVCSGGGTTPTLQSKTVSPSNSQQIITPDSGYDGLSRVTVEAMPSGALSTPTVSSSGLVTAQVGTSGYISSGTKKTLQLTTKGAATITPGTSDQTIASGTYLTGAQTVKGDVNLVPGNIKSGVSIFGVAGNFEGASGSGGSSDNNCEAYHITSTSATLNFKTTGTVKVWGYGAKKSTYTTTLYAFVGDGYYAGSSYGTPSKTSATFGIASDGTLSGLPSDLTAVDLLVTIGV